eukprot:CAMPEP_0171703722 /NCGR_PEP_ID=MMETSP0991-20121206/12285_1 /TAXON_ID=483369 /ORGANISM="non described non described, Strain CCMP2098" /LENGTH=1151 /DNA_ID=CAMNT_0012293159 /DNA_START=163 /DNA_END=3618 /DNA_ORIENTATION=-
MLTFPFADVDLLKSIITEEQLGCAINDKYGRVKAPVFPFLSGFTPESSPKEELQSELYCVDKQIEGAETELAAPKEAEAGVVALVQPETQEAQNMLVPEHAGEAKIAVTKVHGIVSGLIATHAGAYMSESYHVMSSVTETEKFMGINGHLGVGYGLLGGEGSGFFETTNSHTATTFSVLQKCTYGIKTKRINTAKLMAVINSTQAEVGLLNKSLTKSPGDVTDFLADQGSKFVSGVTLGGVAFRKITYSFENASDVQEIKAEMKGKIKVGLFDINFDASFSKRDGSVSTKVDIAVDTKCCGGDPKKFKFTDDANKAMAQLDDWKMSVEIQPVVISVDLTDIDKNYVPQLAWQPDQLEAYRRHVAEVNDVKWRCHQLKRKVVASAKLARDDMTTAGVRVAEQNDTMLVIEDAGTRLMKHLDDKVELMDTYFSKPAKFIMEVKYTAFLSMPQKQQEKLGRQEESMDEKGDAQEKGVDKKHETNAEESVQFEKLGRELSGESSHICKIKLGSAEYSAKWYGPWCSEPSGYPIGPYARPELVRFFKDEKQLEEQIEQHFKEAKVELEEARAAELEEARAAVAHGDPQEKAAEAKDQSKPEEEGGATKANTARAVTMAEAKLDAARKAKKQFEVAQGELIAAQAEDVEDKAEAALAVTFAQSLIENMGALFDIGAEGWDVGRGKPLTGIRAVVDVKNPTDVGAIPEDFKLTYTGRKVYGGDGDIRSEYSGFWSNGYRQGHGKLIAMDGTTYEGCWAKNKQHGRGKLSAALGFVFEGVFKEGKKHGKGMLTLPGLAAGQEQPDVIEGSWENDCYVMEATGPEAAGEVPVKKMITYEDAIVQARKLPDGWKWIGRGIHNRYWNVKESKKEFYNGEFLGKVRHGPGKMLDEDGVVLQEGVWINDHIYDPEVDTTKVFCAGHISSNKEARIEAMAWIDKHVPGQDWAFNGKWWSSDGSSYCEITRFADVLPSAFLPSDLKMSWVPCNIELVGLRKKEAAKSPSWLYVNETLQDIRDDGSTYVCVTQSKYKSEFQIRPIEKTDKCYIELVGARKEGGPENCSWLHVWEKYPQDTRDDTSTYACVSTTKWGDKSEFRMLPTEEADIYHIGLMGTRKTGGYANCSWLHVWEMYPKDIRDENSTYVCVSTTQWGDRSKFRIHNI